MLGFQDLPGFGGLLAFVYLAVCLLFGSALRARLLPPAAVLFDGVRGIRTVDGDETGADVAPRIGPTPPAWVFDVPASFLLGSIALTTFVYLLAYAVDALLPTPSAIHPLLPANLLGMAVAVAATLFLRRSTGSSRQVPIASLAPHPVVEALTAAVRSVRSAVATFVASPFYAISIVLFLLIGAFIMGYVFFVRDGVLYSGVTAFSDYSPHTAMIRSFSHGRNFPTEYPHFADDGIRYHFMFLFFTGNLEFLGLRIDLAFNLLGTLALVVFCSLLGSLGVLLTGRRGVYFLGPLLLFLRASTSFVPFLAGVLSAAKGSVPAFFARLFAQRDFIGDTLRDDWGLWTYNVIGNQRHLLWGASVLVLALFVFLPFVRRMMAAIDEARRTPVALAVPVAPVDPQITTDDLLQNLAASAEADAAGAPADPAEADSASAADAAPASAARRHPFPTLYALFGRRDAWLPKRGDHSPVLAVLLLLVLLPYWHGSVLIATLLVLGVLTIFSEARLVHVTTAALAIGASFLQTAFFAGTSKSIVDPAVFIGFLADDKSLGGILSYSFEAFGLTFVLMLLLLFYLRRTQSLVLASFIVPFVFAFTVSMTPDVTVNHKYIVLSFALVNVFIAGLLCDLWVSKVPRALPAVDTEVSPASASDIPAPAVHVPEDAPVRSAAPFLPTFFQRTLAVVLGIALMTTGVIDTIVYINRNRQSVGMDLDSPLVAWIERHTSPDAVFLTRALAYDAFFLSGRMTYDGWSYFAWSAGHDTHSRGDEVKALFSGCDGDIVEFRKRVAADGISFALVDDDLRKGTDPQFNASFFERYCKVAVTFPELGNLVVYDLRTDPLLGALNP